MKNFVIAGHCSTKKKLSQTTNFLKKIKQYFDCKILYQSKKGYGNALIEGIKETKTKYFCIFNADGSFDPSELINMYQLVENENFDLMRDTGGT